MIQAKVATERQGSTNGPEGGVLAALPRTRPQRTSARRAAAREQERPTEQQRPAAAPKRARTAPRGASGRPTKAAKPTKDAERSETPAPGRKPRKSRKPPEPRAPKQGYEPEEEVELGKTVHPPSGGELVESLADIFGELASAGANAGGRLLKDALSMLRRP